MPAPISFQKAIKKFKEQGRTDIQLCEDGYKGWGKKSKFTDLILDQEFWAIPKSVYIIKSSPLRASENRKKTFLKKYGVEHVSQLEEIKEKKKQTYLTNFGVENPTQSKKIQEKIKQTNLEKYGFESPTQSKEVKEKTIRTNLKKYGTKHTFQSEKVKEKIKQTNLKKYGAKNPFQSKKIKEKIKETNLKKYNVENPFQSEKIKEKIRQTNLKKYGVEYYSQTEEFLNKLQKTSQEKHGTKYHTQSKEIKNKIKQTNLEKYGVKYGLENSEIREKIKQTNLKKYGVESPLQLEIIKEKIKQANLEKYGVENPSQSKIIKNKKEQTCLKNWKVKCNLQSSETKAKIKQTNLEKYGVENFSKTFSNRFVKETGEHLKDWLERQLNPKPAYRTFIKYFPNEQISLLNLQTYFKNYKNHKTNLEVFAENLFNIQHFNRKPKNFDIQFKPDFKLNDQVYLNVDGLYWHCEKQKDKWYHFNLRKEFEENKLQIFQFYENELFEKTDIVKSIVDNAIGKTQNKIFARKCQIKPVPHKKAKIFLNQNHLMGQTTAKHIGLYYQNELISILSYKHKKQKTICNIERFCSKININVVGGFSKLLKHLENNCLEPNCQEIHDQIDLRCGTGKYLLEKGFEIQKETLAWRWTNTKTIYNSLSQKEYAKIRGLHKIYDAGQRLYIKNISIN